ncbi:MAG TPA: cytochrome P450 [Pseudomonadales bacterium]|nr:cytochrome P450 [Pseudomonadales bacterium]
MSTAAPRRAPAAAFRVPFDVGDPRFAADRDAAYRWLLEEAPVCAAKVSILRTTLVSRYDDCMLLLRDPRFVRNRTTATGGRRLPFPMPRAVALLARSMIVEDDPAHGRLRGLVQKAFTSSAIAALEPGIEAHAHALVDAMQVKAAAKGGVKAHVDLLTDYAEPLPSAVIAAMLGLTQADLPHLRGGLKALTSGLSGWRVITTLLRDLPRMGRFVRELIAHKRRAPGADILSALIHAEEAGDRLDEDELVSMVFLLIVAGLETTVHLIGNAVVTLLAHPGQLARLRAEPALLETAVEEVIRYRGPILGTKPAYALEPVTLSGVTIPRGAMVMPMLGAANHDPAVFAGPDVFDIGRTPNRHLGFGRGIHFCLGAPLARMEARIALAVLLERAPGLRLAVPADELELVPMPFWHRHRTIPVRFD